MIDKKRLNIDAVVKELSDEELKALIEALMAEGRRRAQEAGTA